MTDGAAPDVLIVNAPAWVKGTGGSKQTDGSVRALAGTPKQPTRNVETFTTTLYDLTKPMSVDMMDSFLIVMCISGSGLVDGQHVRPGDTLLVYIDKPTTGNE